jgi:hypothetical protein
VKLLPAVTAVQKFSLARNYILRSLLVIYVPLGYAKTFPQLTNVSEVRGGSPWGAGTFAVSKIQKVLHKSTNLF